MDDLENLMPVKEKIELERWNVKDLESYAHNLKEEIKKIEKIINSKKNISTEAFGLFKK